MITTATVNCPACGNPVRGGGFCPNCNKVTVQQMPNAEVMRVTVSDLDISFGNVFVLTLKFAVAGGLVALLGWVVFAFLIAGMLKS